jgi:hypothetical protein
VAGSCVCGDETLGFSATDLTHAFYLHSNIVDTLLMVTVRKNEAFG